MVSKKVPFLLFVYDKLYVLWTLSHLIQFKIKENVLSFFCIHG